MIFGSVLIHANSLILLSIKSQILFRKQSTLAKLVKLFIFQNWIKITEPIAQGKMKLSNSVRKFFVLLVYEIITKVMQF